MRATSPEKREQIIEAKQRGEKTEAIMLWVKVSKSTVDKVWSRYQKTGSAQAKAHTGRPSRITPEIKEMIRAQIAETNDITLEELIEKLDLPIKKSQLSNLLASWGLSFKKRRCTQGSSSARMSNANVTNGVRAKEG
jgi:transposase